ncbi:MAG: hypothetical protein OEZ24_06515, partial [Candidatus Bathyarchaeota archaeon]|nr:hypothetical protein [Candidatus Bathyarchaeota archaeon]
SPRQHRTRRDTAIRDVTRPDRTELWMGLEDVCDLVLLFRICGTRLVVTRLHSTPQDLITHYGKTCLWMQLDRLI